MSDLILHHYAPSPYSEKVRLVLGYKQLAWASVTMPPVLPKPDLFALTGGYRRAPVLQIGADIYCDSELIIAELERRYPDRPLADGDHAATAGLLGWLVDDTLFWQCVRYAMGLRAHDIPQALLDDRAAMHAMMDFDRDTLAGDVPHLKRQLATTLMQLEAALGDKPFFGDERPAAGDFAVYHTLWFLRGSGGIAQIAPDALRLAAWMERIAAFGHGTMEDISAEDARFAAASQAGTPADLTGPRVRVYPEGYPQEAVEGWQQGPVTDRITLARHAAGGTLRIHFPVRGYRIETIEH